MQGTGRSGSLPSSHQKHALGQFRYAESVQASVCKVPRCSSRQILKQQVSVCADLENFSRPKESPEKPPGLTPHHRPSDHRRREPAAVGIGVINQQQLLEPQAGGFLEGPEHFLAPPDTKIGPPGTPRPGPPPSITSGQAHPEGSQGSWQPRSTW